MDTAARPHRFTLMIMVLTTITVMITLTIAVMIAGILTAARGSAAAARIHNVAAGDTESCGRGTGATGTGLHRARMGGDSVASFEAAAEDDVQCAVAKTAGSITLTKSVNGEQGIDWSFDFTVTPAGGSATAKSVTRAAPTTTWTNLPSFTTFTIQEAPSANPRYAPGTITCGVVSGDAAAGITVTLGLNEDLVCTSVNRRVLADLQLQQSTSAISPKIGSTIVWVLDVANHGPSPADQVLVIDALPAGLSLERVSGSGFDCSSSDFGAPGVATCTRSLLNIGETATIQVTTKLIARQPPGGLTNVADVRSITGDGELNNNVASSSVAVASSALVLSAVVSSAGDTTGKARTLAFTGTAGYRWGGLGLLVLGLGLCMCSLTRRRSIDIAD